MAATYPASYSNDASFGDDERPNFLWPQCGAESWPDGDSILKDECCNSKVLLSAIILSPKGKVIPTIEVGSSGRTWQESPE